MSAKLVQTWQRIVVGGQKSWVLFKHGTCVILVTPEGDLHAQATALMKEWGPVHAGSSAGDFTTIKLRDDPGWVIACHHPDILTYVDREELSSEQPTDLAVGLRVIRYGVDTSVMPWTRLD